MDDSETVSVSKGVFVFKNNFKTLKRPKGRYKATVNNMYSEYLWYQAYQKELNDFKEDIRIHHTKMFSTLSIELQKYIRSRYLNRVTEIPTVALLTGINMTDHDVQFLTLEKQIRKSVSPHVACLHSQSCQNIKHLMEHMINQFINEEKQSQDGDLEDEENPHCIKKQQLNLSLLQGWYERLYVSDVTPNILKRDCIQNKGKVLVVIIPNFESFNSTVLEKCILIINSYLNILPFVLVFGIATSLATLHKTLPYHASSKINVKVFNSQPSTVYLNNIIENQLFTAHSPFQLGGKVFNLFTDIFLFYDLSVQNFIQNVQYAMAEHFCHGNAMALCTMEKKQVAKVLQAFVHEDFENVRQLLSFRELVESESFENRIKLLIDDEYFSSVLEEKIYIIQAYIRRLHIFLKCLHTLVHDLPGYPLGRQLRELYAVAVSEDITNSEAYKECFKLLSFQSKEEMRNKICEIHNYVSTMLSGNCTKGNALRNIAYKLNGYLEDLIDYDNEDLSENEDEVEENREGNVISNPSTDRRQFKQALLQKSKHKKAVTKYERIRMEILSFLSDIFKTYIKNPKTFTFHEIFFFNDISIKNRIIGTHRSAIHNALNDPHHYLQCVCCETTDSSTIRACMPDICIAYKLHLECGKMINLYDWLQAYLSIVDPDGNIDESKQAIDPELQARFTQAVAELEYLGFIKSSKRKADHVTRLTWGG